MKVGELIKELSAYDKNLDVSIVMSGGYQKAGASHVYKQLKPHLKYIGIEQEEVVISNCAKGSYM